MRRVVACAFVLVLAAQPLQGAEILIGSGSQAGVYFQAARALCRVGVDDPRGGECEALETPGSVYNVANVQGGALEFGLVQSDVQHDAVTRTGPYAFVDVPTDRVRSVFSLYNEPFTLIARRDAGIAGFDDLPGKRVNIGNPGSGHRALMETVMAAVGWDKKEFQLVTELPSSEHSMALCHNRAQALVFSVGHPNAGVAKTLRLCNAVLADVTGPAIDALVSGHPYYAYAEIPAGTYPEMNRPVRTFGVLATLVTSADVDDETVYGFVKRVFERFDRFRRMHRVFQGLEPTAMVTKGLTAPLHPGARRYYRERGWVAD